MSNRLMRERVTASKKLALCSALLVASLVGVALRREARALQAEAGALASGWAQREAQAVIQDGPLIGTGRELVARRADGSLHIERTRRYTQVKHRETGKTFALPDAWLAQSQLEVSPELRLVRVETTMEFHRSVDDVLGKDVMREHYPALFELDRTRLTAVEHGRELAYQARLGGKLIEDERYGYPRDAVLLELVGLYLSSAVRAGTTHFDFELLLPGGTSHGVSGRSERTSDLGRYAKGYAVPSARLRPSAKVVVIDLWLRSPIKRLFFPHHFYFVLSAENPSELLLLWGGDPELPILAFRAQSLRAKQP